LPRPAARQQISGRLSQSRDHQHAMKTGMHAQLVLGTTIGLAAGVGGYTFVSGRTEEQLTAARDYRRKAQFYHDFVESENSMGFHAPQKTARLLALSINQSRQGQTALRELK
jgi:hypothetical protein